MDNTDLFYLIFLISTNGSMKIKKSCTLELYSAFGGGLKYCILTVFKIILSYDKFMSYGEILWKIFGLKIDFSQKFYVAE